MDARSSCPLDSKIRATLHDIAAAMQMHTHPALMFSGGKDSLACLYLLRPWWDRVLVIWGNAGDPYPETVEQMNRLRKVVPHFIEVVGPGYIHGHSPEQTYPADMVPLTATAMGREFEASAPRFKIHSRFDCCMANVWVPLRNKVNELGVDLVIRGERDAEALVNRVVVSGKNQDGRTHIRPIWHWSKDEVFSYLEAEGVEIPKTYAYGMGSPDCLHCTAWLNENGGKLRYLRDFHPEAAVEYERRLRLIQSEQGRHVRLMKIALGEVESADGEGLGD